MEIENFDQTGLSYSQAVTISGFSRILFVSGQVPEDEQGRVPDDFDSQCRLAWCNVERQLTKGGMALKDLVKVTVYLSDRKYRQENSTIRQEVLGPVSPALTIIVCQIYEEKWLLEIEAIAAQ